MTESAMTNGRDETLRRLRAICLALPEVTERLSHGAPTWFVRGKRTFVTLWAARPPRRRLPAPVVRGSTRGAGGAGRVRAGPVLPTALRRRRGWLGVRLDVAVDWDEIGRMCADAYRSLRPGHAGTGPQSLRSPGVGERGW